jgi:excisionase family DNA binding protein
MSKDEVPSVWTTHTLAEAAGVTTSYIRLLLANGELHGQKMGGVWIIPYAEGQSWLEEREKRAEGPSEEHDLNT